ncbi:type I secretion system permease/ATPase [Halovulum dunhuangense]|uniref:Type I secretion system permease/ATPase n=2 Tax=Halovulum dunhuangense TaxID=1505036 RepID=A0A849L655_9RHOB|nr:type I secretion system permease/ATPase [Halovulum dunhuangense]NNU81642.1 type I secretion system permease/ATPase [Halovulum dunhuangense]
MAAAMGRGRGLILSVGLFSVFVNLLMLTGPLFMLQIYDRVLASRSEATLAALFVLVAALYLLMGLLDHARGRIAARMGARFQDALDARVFESILRRAVSPPERGRPATGLRDLEAVQKFLSAPVFFAIFDLPWAPVFLLAIFLFHPLLGWLAVAGGLVLVGVTLLNQVTTARPNREAAAASAQSHALADHLREEAELIQGLGMRPAVLARWRQSRDKALEGQLAVADRSGGFASFSRSFRFFLQSAMLALGAWLVLQAQLTAGAMIAASILLGRALAPVELAIGGWPLFQRAREGWQALTELLAATPPPAEPTPLPAPRAILDVNQVTVVPPGEKTATLRMVGFRLEPGQALGVIGPSGSGKSTLARAITGIWPTASGKVRLDGATLDRYAPEALGRAIGYLPQDVALFPGTIAENIARLAEEPDAAAVVDAAKRAGAHEMILGLPDGYDTLLSAGGSRLSGGQKQRIGLARAMYGDPALLILDEPNANLDAAGQQALNAAIRQMKEAGRSVVIMAHRPAGIAECDRILVLEGGLRKAYGPRDEVLRAQLVNYDKVAGAIGAEGRK